MKYEIRFDIEVDDDTNYNDLIETMKGIVSFGADEDIEESVSYEFEHLEVIPK